MGQNNDDANEKGGNKDQIEKPDIAEKAEIAVIAEDGKKDENIKENGKEELIEKDENIADKNKEDVVENIEIEKNKENGDDGDKNDKNDKNEKAKDVNVDKGDDKDVIDVKE